MIAVPGSHSLTSVIDVDGMGLDVKENFTTTTGVKVNGANDYEAADYTVFLCENENGMSATKFTFTIN
jgi:bacillopeptidase F (M6 metalloprotease family)